MNATPTGTDTELQMNVFVTLKKNKRGAYA